ncbi:Flagellar basal body rod protein FlgB [bacterium HR19]|nr:Flagellar basal body rod protein FlgB [bacterium HR19]
MDQNDIKIFGRDFELYKQALNMLFQRHLIITSNIANIDTPGYKSKDIEFESYLESIVEGEKPKMELLRTNPAHIPNPYPPPPKPRVFYEMTSFGPDGNSVDLDNEMMKLSENFIRYRIAGRFISGKFTDIKTTLERLRP